MTVASIDIGTNTILLLIAVIDQKTNKIKVLFEDQKIPRIGEGLKPDLPIKVNKANLLLQVLSGFKERSEEFKCEKILVTATNAFRVASNSNELVECIKHKLGLDVNVVSGQNEAKLTFLGCTYEEADDLLCSVIDIGGGSTEIIFGIKSKIDCDFSIPIGVVSLSEKYFNNDPPSSQEIRDVRKFIRSKLSFSLDKKYIYRKAIAAEGTATTLACIKKNLKKYDESLIEGEMLTASEIGSFADKLSTISSREILKNYRGVVDGRQDVLLAGIILLDEIMNHLAIKEVFVSSKGVRYGALYDYKISIS